MVFALAVVAWLALGLPTGWVLARGGRATLGAAALPLAGGLALLLPLIASAWLGGSLTGWAARAGVASVGLAFASWGALRGVGQQTPWPSPSRLAWCAALVPLAAGAGLLGVGSVLAGGWPGYGWDGLAIWLLRAKVLALSPMLPESLFREPLLTDGHWDYPLQLPALLAWLARAGGLEVREYALALAAVLAPLPFAIALALGRVLGPPGAAALAIAPLAVPTLLPIHFEGYADPLLVCVATLGIVAALAAALQRDAALALLAGLALAVAVSLKNEGLLWWAAGVAGSGGVAWVLRTPRRTALVMLLRIGLPGLLLFALWQATCARLGVSSDLAGAQRWDLALSRSGFVSGLVLRLLLAPENAPWLVGCLVGLMAWAGGSVGERLRRVAALLSPLAVYLGGLSLVYLTTPYDVAWHVSTSLPRTLLGVLPVLFGVALLAPLLRRNAEAQLRATPTGGAGSDARGRR